MTYYHIARNIIIHNLTADHIICNTTLIIIIKIVEVPLNVRTPRRKGSDARSVL